MKGISIFLSCSCFCCLFIFNTAVETIAPNGMIRDGETIVSADESFELGFFSPPNSKSRYLGIWYKKIANGTVVWVANRDSPLNDTSGSLQLTNQGTLRLLNGRNIEFWSSNSSDSSRNPVVQLFNTGNLVVKDRNDNQQKFSWQSFDHLTDTLLADGKFGKNFVTGVESFITSRRSADDPSSGDYRNGIDTNGYPQMIIWKGSDVMFRTGPWNGLRFSGQPNLKENSIYSYEFVYNEEEIFYRFQLKNSSVLSRLVLNENGVVQRFTWIDRLQEWTQYVSVQTDDCDRYKLCGAYGSCNINNSPVCGCLKGYTPKALEDWKRSDWSSGCARKIEFKCGEGEGFQKIKSIKIPDTRNSWFNRTMTLKECEQKCLKNCSCTAYANLDIRDGGSGCLIWFNELIDVREYSDGDSQDIYLKLAASELDTTNSKSKKLVVAIVIPILVLFFIILGLYFVNQRKLQFKRKKDMTYERDHADDDGEEKDLELPLFDFTTIVDVTNNFSDFNKIGEGGYGPVYKGILSNGQEIAVKRLSKDSTQGLIEFKNEVLCIAKLQHRNLVKLLGCCIQAQEKMLIYEYMPNKSLDFFIFDQQENRLLDWPKTTTIINGIARGLLYLHQDSRLRIIHRDLKAGNILLDNEMNPKISDFGMARIFGGNQTEANTKIVVGTYGYMPPEYAIDGLFSVKSDVFSFGVLVLEIVSGKRNRGFYHRDHHHNLLGHAWRLYKENRTMELIDEQLKESCIIPEVLCIIHVGLLCVQNNPDDRPTMATVVLMLTSEIVLPDPKEPGFFAGRVVPETGSSSPVVELHSANNMSISLVTAR